MKILTRRAALNRLIETITVNTEWLCPKEEASDDEFRKEVVSAIYFAIAHFKREKIKSCGNDAGKKYHFVVYRDGKPSKLKCGAKTPNFDIDFQARDWRKVRCKNCLKMRRIDGR